MLTLKGFKTKNFIKQIQTLSKLKKLIANSDFFYRLIMGNAESNYAKHRLTSGTGIDDFLIKPLINYLHYGI